MTKATLPPLRLVLFDGTDTRRRALPARTPDGAASISPGLTRKRLIHFHGEEGALGRTDQG